MEKNNFLMRIICWLDDKRIGKFSLLGIITKSIAVIVIGVFILAGISVLFPLRKSPLATFIFGFLLGFFLCWRTSEGK